MYEVAVFFHILGGFIWIGGLLFVQSFWHRIILSDSDDAARSLYDAINWSANRVIMPAALTVLVMGITMVSVSGAWAFSQIWVILALVLFAVSAFGFGTWTGQTFCHSFALAGGGGDVRTRVSSRRPEADSGRPGRRFCRHNHPCADGLQTGFLSSR